VTPAPAAPAGEVAGATAARLRPLRLTVRTRLRRGGRRLTTAGSLTIPSELGRAGTCGGRVTVRVKAGRKTLALKRTALRFDCSYATTVTLTQAPKRKLTVQVRFEGTGLLTPRRAATKTVEVARRPRA